MNKKGRQAVLKQAMLSHFLEVCLLYIGLLEQFKNLINNANYTIFEILEVYIHG